MQDPEKMTRAFLIRLVGLSLLLVLASGCMSPYYLYQGFNEAGTAAFQRGDLAATEQAFHQALASAESISFSREEPVATALLNLGRVKRVLCKDAEAEQLLRRSLQVGEKVWRPESPVNGRRFFELAKLYYNQDRFTEAVPLMERGAANLNEREITHLTPAGLAYDLAVYADALRKINRESDAQGVEARLKVVRARADYSALREKAWWAEEATCKGG
ncbi:MAG: tetratricopeptide repeat protein [Methylococcaceae bacterium]